ncbi:mechanosensitive ion channel domain-containing protein [Alloalcanivorax profundimaris]|uniref:mechanosensitive ion channel domain-containing protein n=1 Tax=Alloalcanivorax profundimaris TaxID=2735259 RepID=UPI0021B00F25|nr:mechanosensitive ion channel domain-containing protein [Alloalcanivorax profundimaris]UWN50229.1 Moderate conductance mechanosensitive channel YbiO [Alcanivorax sp. ALC70]
MPTHRRLSAGLAGLLSLLILMFAPPALAQQQADAGGEPAYGSLADLLEDEASRNALIEELRGLEAARTDQAPGVEGAAPPVEIAAQAPSDQRPEQVSFARRMAATTGHLAANMGDQFAALGAAVGGLLGGGEAAAEGADLAPVDLQEAGAAAVNLAILVIATFVVFFVLRAVARPSFRALSGWALRGSEKLAMLRTIVAVAVAAFVDVVVVALAYLAGGFVSSLLVNEVNADATRLALFLNAFLVVELFKAGLRMLFSSGYEGLRLVPVAADQARYCNRFLANLAGFIGYGMLVLVPVLNFNLSPALGSGVGTVIMLLALIFAVAVILKKRTVLRDRLFARAEQSSGPGRVLLRLLGRLWHVLALAYAVLVFAVTVVDPEAALPFVAVATLLTVVYAGLGLLISVVLSQLIGKEIRLSDRLNAAMPRLQARVNTYVPTGLKIIRALLLVLVAVLVLDAWDLYDLAAWYASEAGGRTVSAIVDVLVILAVAALVWIGLASLLEHKLSPKEDADPAAAARAETLMGLFHTTLAIAIIIMTSMIVLSEIGIDIAPLIAGAGVLGLAVGFGAQKLVQDVITGVFIQLENAMNTGDFVSAGGNSGTVERVGIRSVAMRDLAGTYHIVPFSSVGAVSNYTREFGNHVGEYGIAYRESIDDAIVQLEAAFEELKEGPLKDNILAPLTVAGVSALADSSVNIRVVIKASPGMQWAVGRAYNRLVKKYFDQAGIEIPFPHTTLYFGEDRDGSAPAANVRVLGDSRVVDTQDGGR